MSVTVPAVRSAALGVYTAFRVALFGAYVPVPPLHTAPVAPLWVPARVIAGLFAQTVPFGPAFTVGAGVNVIVLLLDTGLQFPLPVLVNVKVIAPAAISAAVGM